ncbi:MAG TPA: SDR family NAD(P)-dependent oxidoreductase [Ktedonobacterales bacterium]|nr:SDR family NAD(P)-dependent oxidoreductase [Ktedonobacterales bacterium]
MAPNTSAQPAAQHNHYNLAGRVALVTGALGGLGPAICQVLAAAGAIVVGVAGDSHGDLAGALGGLHSDIQSPADISRISLRAANLLDEASVMQLVAGVASDLGRLDIAVNTVGGFAAGQPVSELSAETWDRMLALNARTAFLVSKFVAAPMTRQQWGRIINISSRAARSGRRNAAAYAVAKQAVITLTEAQAEELRDAYVTVNAVLPSIIDTPANRQAMPNADTSRWPTPRQVARVIAFLASDDAGLINGAAIPVYGLA